MLDESLIRRLPALGKKLSIDKWPSTDGKNNGNINQRLTTFTFFLSASVLTLLQGVTLHWLSENFGYENTGVKADWSFQMVLSSFFFKLPGLYSSLI